MDDFDEYMEDESYEDEDDLDDVDIEGQGFMRGYEELGNKKVCAVCGKEIDEFDDPIVKEYNGQILYFCSEECYKEFEESIGDLEE